MEMIKVEKLVASKDNRKQFSPEKMKELVESIKDQGIITPLLVCEIPGQRYEIVAGERRYRAALELKIKEVPCLVRKLSEEEAAQLRIVENLQREDVGPLEEGKEYHRLLKQFGNKIEDIAAKVAKKPGYIRSRLALVNLPEEILKGHMERKISNGHLLIIARMQDPVKQLAIFKEIVDNDMDLAGAERALINKSYDYEIEYTIFDHKDCLKCDHNSSRQTTIFGGVGEDAHCMNPACFVAKTEVAMQAAKSKIKSKGVKILTETEAEQQKFTQISVGWNGISEAQYKKCLKCVSRGMIVSAGFSKATTNDACGNAQCLKEAKAAHKKHNQSQNSGSSDNGEWDLKNALAKILRVAGMKNIKEKMTKRLLLALVCKNIIEGDGPDLERVTGIKGCDYNTRLAKFYAIGDDKLGKIFSGITLDDIDMSGGILDEALGILGVNLKKEVVITADLMKECVTDIKADTLPKFVAHVKKAGYKCDIVLPVAGPVKKDEAKKK